MAEAEFTLQQQEQTFNGLTLMTYSYIDPHPVGMCFVCHGVCEYTNGQINNIKAMAHAHFHVFAFDLPGHGRSAKGTPDSIIPSIPAVVNYWVSFIQSVIEKPEYQNLPRFIYGHSLGATIAILAMRKAKRLLNGAVFSAPTVYINANPILLGLLTPLSSIFPKMTAQALDRSTLSHDPNVRINADKDPLNGQKGIPAITAQETKKACQDIQAHPAEDEYPFYIYHGELDQLTPRRNSEIFYAAASSTDKELHIFPGSFHEVHTEECKEECFRLYIEWMHKHFPPSASEPSEPTPATQPESSPAEEEKKSEEDAVESTPTQPESEAELAKGDVQEEDKKPEEEEETKHTEE